jgi:serine protease Do
VENYVLTAAHCIDPENGETQVSYRTGIKDSTAVVTRSFFPILLDDEHDIAILGPLEAGHSPPARAALAPSEPSVGDRAVAVGHPMGLPYSWSVGFVVAYRDSYPVGVRWMQISAEISPGNSGGPVFNRYGEVVGLVSFRMGGFRGEEAHLGGVVPLNTIREALEGSLND